MLDNIRMTHENDFALLKNEHNLEHSKLTQHIENLQMHLEM